MYGRAEFDLLKLRVLHRHKKSQDRKDKKKNQAQQKEPGTMENNSIFQHTTFRISKVA